MVCIDFIAIFAANPSWTSKGKVEWNVLTMSAYIQMWLSSFISCIIFLHWCVALPEFSIGSFYSCHFHYISIAFISFWNGILLVDFSQHRHQTHIAILYYSNRVFLSFHTFIPQSHFIKIRLNTFKKRLFWRPLSERKWMALTWIC